VKDPNLMILAAGVSSRMKKESTVSLDPALACEATSSSKSMLGIGPGGRPFLDYLLYNAHMAGYKDVVLVIGEHSDALREHYGSRESGNLYNGLTISYAVQAIPAGRTKPLGTADAVVTGLRSKPDWGHRRFTVCNSDNLYSTEVLALLLNSDAECSTADYDRSALGFPPERTEQFGVLRKSPEGFLIEIIEKPTPQDIVQCADSRGRVGVSMNVWRFRSTLILPALQRTPLHPVRGEKELPNAVMLMVKKHPRSLMTYPVAEHVPDLTGRDDIGTVQRYLADHYGSFPWP
jgi:ADP-glucose pyrophosphorylase